MHRLQRHEDNSGAPMRTATTLRERLSDRDAPILVCPGVYDGLSTRIALSLGYEAIYLTDAGTSAPLLGKLDNDHADRQEMRSHAEWISIIGPSLVTFSTNTPIIADGDTGYGGPVMIHRTVQLYAHSGIAGVHIEDCLETPTKGNFEVDLLSNDEYTTRIRAGLEARLAIHSDIVIIACTRSLHHLGFDEAIRRLHAAQEAGADMAYLDGVRSKEEASRVVKEMNGFPCLLNMTYHPHTPKISVKEASDMGYKAVIFPLATIAPAWRAMTNSLKLLKKEGEMKEEDRVAPEEIVIACTLMQDGGEGGSGIKREGAEN